MRLNNPRHIIFRAQAFFAALWVLLYARILIPTWQFVNLAKCVTQVTMVMTITLVIVFGTCRSQIAFQWHKGEGPIRPRADDGTGFAGSRVPNITSYMPKIVYSFRSFTSILACNYYRLRSLLLMMTMLINLLLLTYQAS